MRALVTGASSGIGRDMARILASQGYDLILVARDMNKLNQISKELKEKNRINVEIISMDLSNEENCKELYKKVQDIDILINNAGFGTMGAIENSSRENIYKLVETNLSSVITLSSIITPYLKETKGNIINISSVGGIIPLPFQATYSATKAGIEIFSRALANEVKPFGIKVTAILPGDTKTAFTQNRIVENNQKDEKYKQTVEKSIKKVEKDEQTGKSPDSVAKVVVKVLKKKNPPLRKTVGFVYKLVVFLPRIFSTRLVNYIVRKLYC